MDDVYGLGLMSRWTDTQMHSSAGAQTKAPCHPNRTRGLRSISDNNGGSAPTFLNPVTSLLSDILLPVTFWHREEDQDPGQAHAHNVERRRSLHAVTVKQASATCMEPGLASVTLSRRNMQL